MASTSAAPLIFPFLPNIKNKTTAQALLFSRRQNAMNTNNKTNYTLATTTKGEVIITVFKEKEKKDSDDIGGLHRNMKRLSRRGNLDLSDCKQMHNLVRMLGLEEDVYLGSKLVNMYASCGCMENARQVFDKMSHRRDVVLWTAMINGYASNGLHDEALKLYFEMQRKGIYPDDFTFSSALKACAGLSALKEGMDIHVHINKRGSPSNVFVGSALVDMYAKCGRIEDARQVFDEMPQRNTVSWNTIIAGFQQNEEAKEAMGLFCRMLEDDSVRPDSDTFVSILTTCTHLEALNWGEEIHAQIMKSDLESHVFVGSALVSMYAQCKRLETARNVFDRISERNVVLWSAMISGYSQNGCADEALELFLHMDQDAMKPDPVAIAGVLPACADLGFLKWGKEIHCYAIRNKMESNVHVASALVALYAQCKRLKNAFRVFDRISERNVVLWNALITAYFQNGRANEALKIFRKMGKNGVKPDPVSIASVLPACADLTALKQGREIHCYVIKNKFESNVHVASALVAMYTQCRRLEAACRVFDRSSERNVILWSAMIISYSQNGSASEALKLFRQMYQDAVKPDAITIAGILPACANLACLKQGKEIHCYAIKNQMESNVHVGSALIAMYAQCGRSEAARWVFNRISERNISLWSAMMSEYFNSGEQLRP